MTQLSLLHRSLHLPRLPPRRRHGLSTVVVVVRARLSHAEHESSQRQAGRLAAVVPHHQEISVEAAAGETETAQQMQPAVEKEEDTTTTTTTTSNSRTCALPTWALIGGITAGVAAALALSAIAAPPPALALGPEGPLVEEFWDNMRRYALYALTVSTGVAYAVLQPIVELLKNPITALLIIAFLVGTGFLVSQVLNAMVGNSEFIYRYE